MCVCFSCASCQEFDSPSHAKSSLASSRIALVVYNTSYGLNKVEIKLFESMGKKRKQLSQAEVWDDSALVRSWNDALEEYKVYDSIHSSC